MNNPLNTIKNYIKQQGNPRDLLINFITQNNQNPMINNLIGMQNKGNTKEVETFARNIYKENVKNGNFDEDFAKFKEFFRR